jgi:hypothetical protein
MRLYPYFLPLLLAIPACSADTTEPVDDDVAEGELTSTMTDADLEKAITSAADGVLFTSESDYAFDFVSAPLAKGANPAIAVRPHEDALHNRLVSPFSRVIHARANSSRCRTSKERVLARQRPRTCASPELMLGSSRSSTDRNRVLAKRPESFHLPRTTSTARESFISAAKSVEVHRHHRGIEREHMTAAT